MSVRNRESALPAAAQLSPAIAKRAPKERICPANPSASVKSAGSRPREVGSVPPPLARRDATRFRRAFLRHVQKVQRG
jgi:hypothetical protein